MTYRLKEWPGAWSDFAEEVEGEPHTAKLLTWVEKLGLEGAQLKRNVRPLGDGLFELKISAYRVLYGFTDGDVAIVLCFVKKKQRDQSAINEARRRLKIVKAGNRDLDNVALH
jgi:mRNA-degrading endonuclease RelE of RelBE toxin-antitoxin system